LHGASVSLHTIRRAELAEPDTAMTVTSNFVDAGQQEGLVATKKKGLFTLSGEWAKHLRKWGKRVFWKGERKAAKQSGGKDR
jgi:hypothetical protein